MVLSLQQLKDRLPIPVIGAPLFLASGVDLVVAQCCAGIVGSFPALNARPAEQLGVWLSEIETRLEQFEQDTGIKPAPYAVNLIINTSNNRHEQDLKTCVKHKVPIIITSLASPNMVVDVVKNYGGLVFHDVTTVHHAKKAHQAGVDGVILVCAGAGGHGGTLNPFAFINEVNQFFDGAVLLAGSIVDGRSVLSAQILGCDFAYIGTNFLVADESNANIKHKQMIVDANTADIIYTPMFTGVHGNYLADSITQAGIDINTATSSDTHKMDWTNLETKAKTWKEIFSAGQGVGYIDSTSSTKNIIKKLKQEYNEAKKNIS